MMFNADFAFFKLNKLYIRIVSSSALAAIGIMVGTIPEISRRSPELNRSSAFISFSNYAVAQQFTPEEINNYAKAGYEVEMLRMKVYREIKAIVNQPPGDIVCNREDTLANLNPNVRELTQNFCNQTVQIVQQNSLSVDRYNELKTYYDRRDDFYQQVQNVLIELQN